MDLMMGPLVWAQAQPGGANPNSSEFVPINQTR